MSEVRQTILSWVVFACHVDICCAQGTLAAQHAMMEKELRTILLIVSNCFKKLVTAHMYIYTHI